MQRFGNTIRALLRPDRPRCIGCGEPSSGEEDWLCERCQEKIEKLDVTYDDYDLEMEKLVAPLKIGKAEDLSEQMLSPEEINALTGKTGEELLNDGWTITGYDLDQVMFLMTKDVFEYQVFFEGAVENSEGFNENEAVKALVVREVQLEGFGDATNIE